MASYRDVDKILKENGEIVDLGCSKSKMRNLLLTLIEKKVDHFNYDSKHSYNYLLKIFDYSPYYFQVNFEDKKEFYLKVKVIRNKIKDLLVQKPGHISKNSEHFQFLKDLIDNLETVSLSLLYDYIAKYDGSKYDFINFLVFEVKRINLFEDALKRFPYIVNFDIVINFETKEKKPLIDCVIEKYLEELSIYTKGIGLNTIDDVIYYDEILKLLLSSKELDFNIIDKQKWINNINNLLNNVDNSKFNNLTKQKYIFFLNDLCNSIQGINNYDLDYLKYKYDVKSSFNQSINVECQRIIQNDKVDNKRKLINDEIILTFDGEGAKEIDDALSIKILDNGNYLLGVHIADPLYFVKSNSIIYDEAKRRTTSIYLSDMTVSMFPKALSSDCASLLEGKRRPATSYYYEISKDGEVINYNFYKSYIQIYKNMTYHEFNNILEKGYLDLNIYQSIVNLSYIQTLLARYYKVDPFYEEINRRSNNITDTNITGCSLSEKVVESAMIFNNHMVASYFYDRKLPFIYRVHAINNEEMAKIDRFSKSISLDEKSSKYSKYIGAIKNIYPRAIYSLENSGHFGLNLKAYSHVTSPLRRFADVLASECLNKLYFNPPSYKDVYEMQEGLAKIREELDENIVNINQKRLSLEIFSANYEKSKHNF